MLRKGRKVEEGGQLKGGGDPIQFANEVKISLMEREEG